MARNNRKGPGYRTDVEHALTPLLLALPSVRPGKMFGFPAFYAGKKLFACVYGEGVGVKLPEQAVERLVGQPGFVPFQPYGKPKMREWIEIRRKRATDYTRDLELFREAAAFVASGQRPARPRGRAQ